MKAIQNILFSFFKLISLIVISAIAISFVSPFYSFPETTYLSGDKIYNPYENINTDHWINGNFQVQSNAWGGVTNGRNNTDSLIFYRYKEMGFDIVSISDYQKINKYNAYSETYVPVYEHGFGIFKNHQVCLGSKKVEWLDFPVYHTLHHKQFVINRLKKNNELVAIAHPKLWGAYDVADMTKLANYDLIEVLNNYRISDKHWDAALSSGKPVFLLANDDAHDVHNIREVGRRFTVLNVQEKTKESILSSLKYGLSYGVDLENSDSIWEEKAAKIKSLPKLNSVEVINDTVFYTLSDVATEMKFISQNGEIVKIDSCCKKSYYVLKKNDTYVRAEIKFDNLATFYLNPVYRYNGSNPIYQSLSYVDETKTNTFRITLFIVLIFIFGYRIYYNQRSKTKDEEWLPTPV